MSWSINMLICLFCNWRKRGIIFSPKPKVESFKAHKELARLRSVKSTCAPAYLLRGASQRAQLLSPANCMKSEFIVHYYSLRRGTSLTEWMPFFPSTLQFFFLLPSRLHMTSNIHLSRLVGTCFLWPLQPLWGRDSQRVTFTRLGAPPPRSTIRGGAKVASRRLCDTLEVPHLRNGCRWGWNR